MNKADIKQIILEEIKYALKEMSRPPGGPSTNQDSENSEDFEDYKDIDLGAGLEEIGEPDPELYPDGYDFEDEDPAVVMAAQARIEDEDEDMEGPDYEDYAPDPALGPNPSFVEEDLYEMARTPNVFKISRSADIKEVLQFMFRVNNVLKKYKSPGQKKPKKRFTPEEMRALADVMVNPKGFGSQDIVDAGLFKQKSQANNFLKALEMKGLITLTSVLKKSMEPERDPNAPETRGRKPKSRAADMDRIPTPDDEDFDPSLYDDNLDIGPVGESLKRHIQKVIKEAKKSPLASKMKEIENQGKIAALETKLAAIQEMIDETNDRLTRIDEDHEFRDMMDQNAVREVRKQLKELERAQAKLQKEYGKYQGKGMKRKKVVDEVEDDDIPGNPNDPNDHPALPEEFELNEGRYPTDNDPRFLYPDLFDDMPTQTDQEWIVDYMGDSVEVTAPNKGAAIKAGADMMGVPGPDEEYMTATLKNSMNESILRMQKLAGLITENVSNEADTVQNLIDKGYAHMRELAKDFMNFGDDSYDEVIDSIENMPEYSSLSPMNQKRVKNRLGSIYNRMLRDQR